MADIEDELDAAETKEAEIAVLVTNGWPYKAVCQALEVTVWRIQVTMGKIRKSAA